MPQAWPPKGIIAQGATYSVNSSEHVLHRTRRVSLPPAVKWPRAASSTAILRSDRRWRCSSFANATVSGFASAYVLRPLHLPVAAFLRSRALPRRQEPGKGYGQITARRSPSWPRCSGASTTPLPASASRARGGDRRSCWLLPLDRLRGDPRPRTGRRLVVGEPYQARTRLCLRD